MHRARLQSTKRAGVAGERSGERTLGKQRSGTPKPSKTYAYGKGGQHNKPGAAQRKCSEAGHNKCCLWSRMQRLIWV